MPSLYLSDLRLNSGDLLMQWGMKVQSNRFTWAINPQNQAEVGRCLRCKWVRYKWQIHLLC